MSPSSRDWLLGAATRGAACAAGGLLLLIIAFVANGALPALHEIGATRLIADRSWHPTEGTFGLGPMLIGSLAVSAGAVLCAAPLGILAAIFTVFYAPRPIAWLLGRVFEVIAAIPSVVFGLWGLVVIVPRVAAVAPPGPSLCAATLVLALMIVPTVALTARIALAAVPHTVVQGATALAVGRTGMILRIALPAARSGIVAGIVLAVGRALGETMAVLMVCGNVVQVPGSIFDPVRTVTANIALEMGYATGAHRSALFASGLALVVVVAGLVALAGGWDRGAREA